MPPSLTRMLMTSMSTFPPGYTAVSPVSLARGLPDDRGAEEDPVDAGARVVACSSPSPDDAHPVTRTPTATSRTALRPMSISMAFPLEQIGDFERAHRFRGGLSFTATL
ncbi:hypothetical protein GCM10023191_040480 [Actinoallomurus oryzae]|uniref:Uncharacterized protein n=1 Tax=Actinoallomurus oryzae TaxID=502180 RepID=A0ABP8Q5G0_9ACTN